MLMQGEAFRGGLQRNIGLDHRHAEKGSAFHVVVRSGSSCLRCGPKPVPFESLEHHKSMLQSLIWVLLLQDVHDKRVRIGPA